MNPTFRGTVIARAQSILHNARTQLECDKLNYQVLDAVGAVRYALHHLAAAIAAKFGAASSSRGARLNQKETLQLFASFEELCKRFQMPK